MKFVSVIRHQIYRENQHTTHVLEATSDIIHGKYGDDVGTDVIYGTLTTPSNAIGGSAICVYNMKDVIEAFEGSFKHQDGINANWLPVPEDKVRGKQNVRLQVVGTIRVIFLGS